jgi:hypothetical protein
MCIISRSALIAATIAMLGATMPASAVPERAGKQTGQARPNVQKPQANAVHAQNRPAGNRNQSAQRPNAKRGGNNVVAGNTVVVGGQPGRGHYDNGRYQGSPNWDDDDNDFLEFVGKTAAITAGVSVVTAVVGSVVKDKPSDCQPVVSGNQQYMLCNGTYYQTVSNGYQVVAPPQ